MTAKKVRHHEIENHNGTRLHTAPGFPHYIRAMVLKREGALWLFAIRSFPMSLQSGHVSFCLSENTLPCPFTFPFWLLLRSSSLGSILEIHSCWGPALRLCLRPRMVFALSGLIENRASRTCSF